MMKRWITLVVLLGGCVSSSPTQYQEEVVCANASFYPPTGRVLDTVQVCDTFYHPVR